MNDVMYTAASGAVVSQLRLDVISNNLSNMNTAGFKRDRTIFRSYFPPSYDKNDNRLVMTKGRTVNGKEMPLYFPYPANFHVGMERVLTDFSQGVIKNTGNPLDLALNGEGFFCVKTPSGIRYTRKGDFSINSNGLLVTKEGFPVLGKGGPITLTGTDIKISGDGTILVDDESVGTLKIVDFPKPYQLEKEGGTLFRPRTGALKEEIPGNVEVVQGAIELSNVSSVEMMTNMISVMRNFESYQKMMQIDDGLTTKTINTVGNVP